MLVDSVYSCHLNVFPSLFSEGTVFITGEKEGGGGGGGRVDMFS